MEQEIEYSITLKTEECCSCGTSFAIESTLQLNLRRTGQTFYCPNGHPQFYSVSAEDKLKKAELRIKSLEDQRLWWKNEAETKAHQLSAIKEQLTKTKKRLAGGACPCCNRQFVQLTRHMKTKHPDYSEKE